MFFHTFPFLFSFTSPELWGGHANLPLVAASRGGISDHLWPQALREKGAAHCPKSHPWAWLLSVLHEVHSLCLPRAQALVITGFRPYPPRRAWSATHFSAQLLLWSPGFPPRGEPGPACLMGAAGSEQAEAVHQEPSMPFVLLSFASSLQGGPLSCYEGSFA